MNYTPATRNLIIYLFVLLMLYVIPFRTQTTLNTHYVCGLRLDYILHATLFIPIPFLLKTKLFVNPVPTILLIMVGAMLVEGLHLVIPHRSFSGFDMIANLTGISIGSAIVWLRNR